MIWFNDIELDYNKDTLNNIVIKRAITDIESVGNRKGTASTTFDVPRTAINEKAFGFITTEGSVAVPVGDAKILLDGNVYSTGTIKVRGYNDTIFKCLYLGEDLDLINEFKETPLKDVISVKFSETFTGAYVTYVDSDVKTAMGTTQTGLQLDYCYNVAQVDRANYNIDMVTPFFTVNSIIEKMFTNLGVSVESDFMSKTLPTYLFYSNFSGVHLSSNLLEGATNTLTASATKTLDLGAVNLGNGITKTGTDYFFVDTVTKLKLKLILSVVEDPDVIDCTVKIVVTDSTATTIRFTSTSAYLLVGENTIEIDADIDITAGDILTAVATVNLSGSLPINYDVTVTDAVIQHDNIQENAKVLLNDYLNDGSQLEFLSSFLRQYNLVLDVDGDTAYIECQDEALINNETTNGIVEEEIDITNEVENIVDVSLDYSIKKYILFKQGMLSQAGVNEIQANEVSTTGSWYKELNPYGEGTEIYTVIFNSCYTALDGYQLSDVGVVQPANLINVGILSEKVNTDKTVYPDFSVGIGYLDSWEDLLSIQAGITNFGTTSTVDYINIDTTTSSISKFDFYLNPLVRFYQNRNTKANTIFVKTLERKRNNKIKEIELFDSQGTLMSFRKDYIINKQLYKLISYEFEPVSRRVKAKIILK